MMSGYVLDEGGQWEASCKGETCFSCQVLTRRMKELSTTVTDMLHTTNIFRTSTALCEKEISVVFLAVVSLQYAKYFLILTDSTQVLSLVASG